MAAKAEIVIGAKDDTAGAFAAISRRFDALEQNASVASSGILGISKKALIGLAGAASFSAAYAGFDGLIERTAKLQDLAETTGTTAAALASLQVAANVGGVGIDLIAQKSVKLTKNLTGVGDESESIGAALAQLNIPIEKFKQLDPVARYEALSKALAGFREGPGETAILEDIVKGGAELLPFLKALDELGGRQSILTQEQIALADEYKDKQAKSRAELELYAQALATQVLPAIAAFTGELSGAIKPLTGIGEEGGKLKRENSVRDFAQGAAVSLAVLGESAVGVAKFIRAIGGSFEVVSADVQALYAIVTKGPGALFKHGGVEEIQGILEQRNKVVEEANQRYVDLFAYDGASLSKGLIAKFAEANAAAAKAPGPGGKDNRASLDGYQGKRDVSGILKKQLEGRLQAIARALKDEQELFDFSNKRLDQIYEVGDQALTDFYAAKRDVTAAYVAAQLKASDEEIAALQRARDAARKPDERIDLDNKLAAAKDKRAGIEVKATRDIVLANADEAKAIRDLSTQYRSFLSDVASLRGDDYGAAVLVNANKVEAARKLILQSGGTEQQVQDYARLLDGISKVSIVRTELARISEKASAAEDLYSAKAELAGTSEIDQLKEIGRIRSATLPLLRDLVDQADALAESLKTPDAIAFAQRLRASFAQAVVSADTLGKKAREVNDQLGEFGADFFRQSISGGKKVLDVLDDIGKKIRNLLLDESIYKPFAKAISGGLSGNGQLGGLLGGLGSLVGRALNLTPTNSDPLGDFINGLSSKSVGSTYVERDMVAQLHKGERVLTAAQNRDYSQGGGNVTVQVINNGSGTKVSTQEGQGANGDRFIKVIIDEVTGALSRDVSAGRGQLTAALQGTYGLNRAAGALR